MKIKIVGIYALKNKINNKIYIGYSKDIEYRWQQHRSDFRNNKHDNYLMQPIYNKYGLDIFEFLIIKEMNYNITSDQLGKLEKLYIAKYKANDRNYGYNLNEGGKGGMTGFKHSQEFKDRLSEMRKGKNNPNWHGKSMTKDSKRKCKEKVFGKKRPSHSEKLQGKKRNGKNIFVGIYKKNNGYYASITYNNKNIYIGSFKSNIFGAMAYDREAIRIFGNNAKINFPELLDKYLIQNYMNIVFEGIIEPGDKNKHSYKGIYLNKKSSKWIARLTYKKILYYLGRFDTKEDAALAYNKKTIEFYGNNARINKIKKEI